jgi:hypothetical protein
MYKCKNDKIKYKKKKLQKHVISAYGVPNTVLAVGE